MLDNSPEITPPVDPSALGGADHLPSADAAIEAARPEKRDTRRPPPIAGSIEEAIETAKVVGYAGGLGGSFGRES